ncbi:MAG: MATE family efflux transporter [Halobacteriaceae archaeon]
MSIRHRIDEWFKGPDELDLTTGAIGKPLFFLSLPIVITNLLQTAYNLADTFWLGQYSTNALAAITFAFPLVFLMFSLGMGVTVAGSVLVAQHIGADEEQQAMYAASQTVSFAIVVATLLGIVGYMVVDEILLIFGAEPDVLQLAVAYLQIIALGLPFMFGFFVFISLMRGYGNTVTPMFVMLFTVVVNILLDPFLIFGWTIFPELGVVGAAVATVFARGMAFIVGLVILFRGHRGVEISISDMEPDIDYARKIIDIGLPASIEMTGRSVSVNLMLIIVGLFSTPVVAGYGIGIRMFSVIFLPAIAVARGVETMTGQNIGANKPDRAAEAARLAAIGMFGILTLVGALVWIRPDPIANLFTDNPEVILVARNFLRWVAPTFGFIGVMRAYTGSFRGAGKTLTSAVISITMLGVIRLPVAWFTIGPLGSNGIWLSFAVSNVIGAILAYGWYQRGTWREADVTGEPGVESIEGADVGSPETDD